MSFPNSKGYTLLEMMIVIAIIGILASMAVVSFGSARNKNTLEDARTSLVRILEEARNDAASGVGTSKYRGVRIEASALTLFENPTIPLSSTPPLCSASATLGTVNKQISLSSPITVIKPNSLPCDIIFTRISATSTASTTIVLTNSATGLKASTTVTFDGAIYPY